ncbi:hypothetical protein OIU84_005111 [Salix udensis]|uniref:GDSL esterase/lipase EXL3 n=1 Tax=Salix udensis TaxID=889485 RepID=A0AAD6JVB4_9ROSI|nr:hypothetical protein OIU84_005111 [Salix udensis]
MGYFLRPKSSSNGISAIGLSVAVAFDPLTPRLVSVLTLSDQLEHFKEYIGKLKAIIGEENTTFTLTNSLFIVVASSDDIANTYFTLRARALQYDVPAYTDLMANSASSFVQELYELGARRIGVFSAPPVGCVPSQRTLAGGAERECAENLNEAAKVFNSKLSKKLDSLASSLPSGRFVYLDIYNPLLDLIQNPRKYGFQVADKGCCGTGTLEDWLTDNDCEWGRGRSHIRLLKIPTFCESLATDPLC